MTTLFVGPLPPPVHGFSVINQAMLAAFQAVTAVLVFDRSPQAGGAAGRWGRLRHWLGLVERFWRASRSPQPGAVYIGISGGWGQLLDLPFIALARWSGRRVYVHHHSFAYLNQPTWLSRVAFRLLAPATHIALGPEMAGLLIKEYALKDVRLLSNLAFLDLEKNTDTVPEAESLRAPQSFTVGFLSNITVEKGIFEFFDVVEQLHKAGVKHRALVAGPVAPSMETVFHKRLGELAWVEHVGPIYGQEKANFYHSLDWLLFPTKYANEAEPVTLLEAMAAGVQVLAAERGCIRSMLADGRGYSTNLEGFSKYALEMLGCDSDRSVPDRKERRKEIASLTYTDWKKARLSRDLLVQEILSS